MLEANGESSLHYLNFCLRVSLGNLGKLLFEKGMLCYRDVPVFYLWLSVAIFVLERSLASRCQWQFLLRLSISGLLPCIRGLIHSSISLLAHHSFRPFHLTVNATRGPVSWGERHFHLSLDHLAPSTLASIRFCRPSGAWESNLSIDHLVLPLLDYHQWSATLQEWGWAFCWLNSHLAFPVDDCISCLLSCRAGRKRPFSIG